MGRHGPRVNAWRSKWSEDVVNGGFGVYRVEMLPNREVLIMTPCLPVFWAW